MYPGIIGYGANFSQMTKAMIIAKPKVMVVITAADLQGLRSETLLIWGILVVSTPLDSQEKEGKSTDRKDTTDIINPSENLSASEAKGIHSRGRPIEDKKKNECPAVDNQ